jgi:adhesin transport system membrane fusion protein
MDRIDFEETELIEQGHTEQSGRQVSMILMLGLLLGFFIIWATFFKFDTTVRATGKVIPSVRTQVIQVADGGVLSQVLVKEGSDVVAGELLAVLEKERANAKYLEESARVTALEIAVFRAKAEIQQRPPEFDLFQKDNPEIVRAQYEYYQQRQFRLKKGLRILQSSLQMAKAELDMNRELLETGDASRIEVMRAQRQVNDVKGKIMEMRHQYLDEAHKEIISTETELKSLRFKIGAANSVLNHTEILSPVTGVVKFLSVNTLGGVLRPGDELMQISPSKGGLIIEAKVKPTDIALLDINMPVFIKLDAFDYSIYGNLKGWLSYISSDTLTEKDASGRESVFYSVQVLVDEEHLANEPKLTSVRLKQGMNVTIDIKTGEKTVFNYLAKPIVKAFSGAVH